MRSYIRYLKSFLDFRSLSNNRIMSVYWKDRYPCLHDDTESTGFDAHYLYHLAWAARILAQIKPELHVDIGSSLHFCTLVSAFIPLRFYDFRPANIRLSSLTSESANLLSLPFMDESVKSLSCMHVVEHVGLGRYGDQLDPDGDLKAIAELKRVLVDRGDLLFVVPIGKPKIMFNAHRIYSYDQIIGYFSDFDLHEFALVADDPASDGLIINAAKELADVQTYGCGCFHFRKVLQ